MSSKFFKQAAIGCGTTFGILFAASFIFISYWLWSSLQEQEKIAENIEVRIDNPLKVKQHEEFEINIYVENKSALSYKLVGIDVPPEYFEEVNIFDAQPPFYDRFVGAVTGDMNYKLQADIPPQQTLKVTLFALSENIGVYREFIDVCINNSSTCVGSSIKTEVISNNND